MTKLKNFKKFEAASAFLKHIAHPVRLSILCELIHRGELSVNDLVRSQRGVSQSQVSQFLAKMKADHLIESRKESQFVYYAIKSSAVRQMIHALDRIFCSA